MKIVFATDLHLGAAEGDFHQQAYWAEGLPHLVECLVDRLQRWKADMLLLGGDLVGDVSPQRILQCVDLLRRIELPTFVCLGNHDLSCADAISLWRDALARWPSARLADAAVSFPACDLILLNNHWIDDLAGQRRPELRWRRGSPNHPCLTAGQIQWLDQALVSGPAKRPAIVAVHADLDALPPELTGLPQPIHVPPADYADAFNAVADRHPRLRLVLNGHNHATHALRQGRRAHMTCGSMSEFPFYVRLVEVTADAIDVTTRSLCDPPADLRIDPGAAWVLAREQDRTARIPL